MDFDEKVKIAFGRCLQRGKKGERGIRLKEPSMTDARGFLNKARHNLEAADYLIKGKFTDWAIISAYYAMYHASLSVLSAIGVKSEDHACTSTALEYFFVKKGKLEKAFVNKFDWVKDMEHKIEKTGLEKNFVQMFWKIRGEREKAQYQYKTSVESATVYGVIKTAISYVNRMQELINEMI